MYLKADVYNELLQYLMSEMNDNGVLAGQFQTYFTQSGGYYYCADVDAYTAWLGTWIDGDDYGDFVAWDTSMTGQSGQGGGTFNINPFH